MCAGAWATARAYVCLCIDVYGDMCMYKYEYKCKIMHMFVCSRGIMSMCVCVRERVHARVSASMSDFCIERRAHPAFVCLLSDGSHLWRSRDFSFHINVSTKRLLRKITSATRLLVTRPWNYYTCLRSDFTPLSIVRHCVGKCYMLVITCRKCV